MHALYTLPSFTAVSKHSKTLASSAAEAPAPDDKQWFSFISFLQLSKNG